MTLQIKVGGPAAGALADAFARDWVGDLLDPEGFVLRNDVQLDIEAEENGHPGLFTHIDGDLPADLRRMAEMALRIEFRRRRETLAGGNREAELRVRVRSVELATWDAAADAAGQTRSAWVRDALNRALEGAC